MSAEQQPTPESMDVPKLLISARGKILALNSKKRRGGLIKDGLDGAGYHLMETQAGLNALRQFAQMGQMKPLYLSQEFFDRTVM